MAGEFLPLADQIPEPIDETMQQVLSNLVINLIHEFGKERIHGDGYTVAFLINPGMKNAAEITCRHMNDRSAEFDEGVYIDRYDVLAEYEDGTSVKAYKEYSLPTYDTPYIRQVYQDLNENDEVVVLEPDTPLKPRYAKIRGMQKLVKARREEIKKLEADAYGDENDGGIFSSHDYDELIILLSGLTHANVTVSEDEIADNWNTD